MEEDFFYKMYYYKTTFWVKGDPTNTILSLGKGLVVAQLEFVDSQAYFDALMLQYLL
jgi:hypothetical protein